jgi:hypothetical protein
MFGKCPRCSIALKQEELKNLKEGESARCFICGRLYVSHPLWIYLKLFSLFLPILVIPFKVKLLTLLVSVTAFISIIFYHEIQAYLPLIEENEA